MSKNPIGLKTQVLEGLLEETLGANVGRNFPAVCYAGSGWDSN